jgi:hypothetical protein
MQKLLLGTSCSSFGVKGTLDTVRGVKNSSTLMASNRPLAHPVHKPLDGGEVFPHLTGDPPQQTTVLAALLAAGVRQLVAVPGNRRSERAAVNPLQFARQV